MEVTFNQHVGIFKNTFSSEWCDKVIKIYKKNKELEVNRIEHEGTFPLFKNDHHIPSFKVDQVLRNKFENFIQKDILVKYNEKYTFIDLGSNTQYHIDDFKIQKTLPAEGYHVWHYENAGYEVVDRVMAWMVYLNDVKKGGETEFLHQSLRIKPKKGTLLVWPDSYTHLHRGNPPLKGKKYITTGWIKIANAENTPLPSSPPPPPPKEIISDEGDNIGLKIKK